jgi:hypothetical protein
MKPRKAPKAPSLPKGILESGKRRKPRGVLTPTGRAVVAGALIGAGALGVGGVGLYRHLQPHRIAMRAEARVPGMVEAARSGDFHRYDRMAFESHPRLRRLGPTVLKHWEPIREIAGTNYNAFAVVDTLSRRPGQLAELESSRWVHQNAGTARSQRIVDILNRTSNLSRRNPEAAEAMLRDLYKLPSRDIRRGRETFYGRGSENWRYGRIASESRARQMRENEPHEPHDFNKKKRRPR